ncbi:hypothetical protein Hdeb2414_s0002g00081121 [Helianthus debilis subsp. tardiflorus]
MQRRCRLLLVTCINHICPPQDGQIKKEAHRLVCHLLHMVGGINDGFGTNETNVHRTIQSKNSHMKLGKYSGFWRY